MSMGLVTSQRRSTIAHLALDERAQEHKDGDTGPHNEVQEVPQGQASEGVDASLVVAAEAAETSRGISSLSLHGLFSVPVVFLINTFEIFMKATSMKKHNITLK